ncbi:TPA: LysR family transcriptional regulator, partial [Klebsiella pneumoniae]
MAFESAARHQSFTRAADELALTQSAVCRQIATLETFLGVELFRRSRRGVKLTEAGLTYSRKVAAQLDAVERDTLALMGAQGAMSIELAVVPTFATQWLLPRLA